jgi:hypothetical protein
MKKKLLTLSVLLIGIFAHAQVPYTPFPKGDINWYSKTYKWGDSPYLYVLSIDTALLSMDSKIYNKVVFGTCGDERYIAGVREEDKKIYLFVPELGEHLIYDFGFETSRVTCNASRVKTINIAHLPAGIYFVKITTDRGTQTQKIIKL